MTPVLVAVGGAFGACSRYLVDRRVQTWHDTVFPWGTLVVNVLGSLLLGFLTGASFFGVHAPVGQSLVGVGFCGALTTYSTFGYETVRMFLDGSRIQAVGNVVATVLAGIGAGVVGIVIAAAFWL